MRLVPTTVALAAIVLMIGGGCMRSPKKAKDEPDPKAGHQHPDKGPHGGALAEWGEEEFHAEFTVDHGKKQATVFILDGEVKKAVPIPAPSITIAITNVQPPLNLTLKADPQAGDPKGKASRFSGTHEALGKEMDFKGEISGKVNDTPFTGSFDEKQGHKHK